MFKSTRSSIYFTNILIIFYLSLNNFSFSAEVGSKGNLYLNSISDINLGVVPNLSLMDSAGRNIFFSTMDQNTIARFDTTFRQVVDQRPLGHTIDALLLDNGGSSLLAAGSKNGNSAISRLDTKNLGSAVSTVVLDQGLRSPLMADDGLGNVYLADAKNAQILRLSVDDFVSEEFGETPKSSRGRSFDEYIFYSGRGIAGFAVSQDGSVAFVADASNPVVSALETSGKFTILDSFSQTSSDPAALPDVISVASIRLSQLSGKRRAATSVESILIADGTNDRLFVAQFDPIFQTMNLVAEAKINLPVVPGAIAQPGESALLIGSDSEQRLILVGSKFSNQAALYVRLESGLKLVRNFVLRGTPSSLDVADNGQSAIIVYPKDSIISRIDARSAAQKSDRIVNIFGSDDVRQLQEMLTKFGSPVGNIDGVIGSRTTRALEEVIKKNNIELSIENFEALSPEQLLDAIKALENAG